MPEHCSAHKKTQIVIMEREEEEFVPKAFPQQPLPQFLQKTIAPFSVCLYGKHTLNPNISTPTTTTVPTKNPFPCDLTSFLFDSVVGQSEGLREDERSLRLKSKSHNMDLTKRNVAPSNDLREAAADAVEEDFGNHHLTSEVFLMNVVHAELKGDPIVDPILEVVDEQIVVVQKPILSETRSIISIPCFNFVFTIPDTFF